MAATGRVLFLLVLSFAAVVRCQDNIGPLFQQPLYVFAVNEELSPGSLIGRVGAFDEENDPLTFYVAPNSLNSNIFSVNGSGNIGEIYFTGPSRLDRETLAPTNQALFLTVTVTDGIVRGVPEAEATVRVFLRDINDNPPVFSNLPASVNLAENVGLNTTVFDVDATDSDFGANARLHFFIMSVDGESCDPQCGLFDIDISTGVVTLNQTLDYDVPNGRQHTIDIRAEDRGSMSLMNERTLMVVVNDVNDRNPLFSLNTYRAEVHENLTFGDPIVQVTAFDQDIGINDAIVYSIISGNTVLNGVGSFAIDPSTGVISVNTATLDRETHEDYILTVQAAESMDPDNTDIALVQITILDINDHAPFFLQSFYSANVSENAGIDTMVVMVTAMDRDDGVHARFEFILENLDNSSEPLPFAIRHDVLSGEGSVVLTRQVDFETQTTYNFRVTAQELIDDLPMNGSTTVTINVINENDNSPVFLNDSYFASIPENVQPPAFIALVTAIDADIGTFGEVEYSLIGSNPLFNISSASGRVETTGRLDFEIQSRYVFTVQAIDLAQDQRNLGAVTLTVDVENLNDNPPRFDVNLTMVDIDEEQPASQTVLILQAEDEDGELTEQTFSIQAGNEDGHFIIIENELQTVVPLDFDLATNGIQDYMLTILVNDTENIDLLNVYIRVVDINDNSPVFDNTSYSFDVFENEVVGYLVGEVRAEDIDTGTFGSIEYSISGPGAISFEVNSTTGEIRTANLLDRELQSTPFELVVTATDLDAIPANRRVVSVPLTISVLDRNDNRPVFDRSTYIFELEENTELIEFQVRATDMDIGSNMEITYNIVSSSNGNNAFIIDESSGIISRNSLVHLDYELVQQYVLNVSATDNGDIPNVSTVEVIINILDVNDVIPTFESTLYNSTISEDASAGSIVTGITAMDEDSNENGQLFYSIVISVSLPVNAPTGSFIVDESTGIISTTGSFDREAFSGPYTIMIFVRDGGFPVSHNSSTTLLVYIDDSNDNEPIFMPRQYNALVDEELPAGQSLTTVAASDRDKPSTLNSDIQYFIVNVFSTSGSVDPALNLLEQFSIDVTSGLVTTNASLDFEQVSSYRIEVQANDLGTPQRSSNAFVTVTVGDINDQPPVLSQQLYQVNVTEDTSINTRFNLISATDADSAISNSQIYYTADISTPFRVDTITGELVLTRMLDFETAQFHVFMVNASDGVFVDTATVSVRVFDVNDHTPEFQQDTYSIDVNEGNYTLSPRQLIMVSASDDDSGLLGTVEYDIFPSNDLFSVDATSGVVMVVGAVDRETSLSHTLTILARDGGTPPETATATLVVNILDVNDNAPVLERPSYSAIVVENTGSGQLLATVEATDEDAGMNGQVEYSFQSSSADFNIDRFSGEVTTTRAFDFERETSFQLTIEATDNSTVSPLSATALLTVSITDVNDNGPIFTTPPRSLSLSEDVAIGSVVTSVIATDADSGDNGMVVYQLANDEGRFSINATTGVVVVSELLDREVSSSYNLTVTAMDRGQPQRSAVQNILVTVLDVNDVIPMFERDSYSFVVSEDFTIGNTIGSIRAVDSDLGINADTIFTLVQGNANLFTILRTQNGNVFTGHIISNQLFDYEQVSAYSLVVQATNTEQPRNFTTASVVVSIRDINDNPPVFSMASYILRIPEGTPIGNPIGTVVATDNDGGINGTVVYDFLSSTSSLVLSTFAISNTSGVLTLVQSLDHETQSMYSFQILASDSAIQRPLTSTVSVQVIVEDENEGSPVFELTSYSGSVLENADAGQSVLTVNATESDATSIQFSIVAGGLNRFNIDSISGLIRTAQTLDREEQDRYVLTVQASDTGSGGISLSSFVQVDITVDDVNDNAPTFSSSLFEFTLPEHSSVGTSLTTLQASDPDQGINALITYSIDQGTPFTVDANTGLITVISPNDLNREATPTVELLLTATDRGVIPRSNNVRLRVILSDINDNDPSFELPSYTGSVPENSPSGVSIVTVQASDLDGDIPSYVIISGDDVSVPKFRINSETGLIETTDNTLDREMLESVGYTITLQVEASDQRPTPRTTVVPVVISVLDVNDLAPDCGGTYSYSVAEDNILNVRIGQVTATDGDSGQNAVINYHIASGDPNGAFQISSTSGELFGRPGLDFETSPVYVLGVAAVDQAPDSADRMTSICMVTVSLQDENDNRPVFDQAVYEAVILENATIGTTVTVVGATDLDTGVNGVVSYSFQSPTRAFSIDASLGIITISDSLDSETVPLYELDVEGRDGGSPPRIGSTTLIVRVADVNDNSPRFDRSIYMQTVSEDDPVDTTVINLDATDVDSSSITYAIFRGNENGYFKINTLTGVIQIARSLDRETVAVVHLGVAAMDKDSNTGNTTVQVTIEDVNDEAPQFLQPSYFARVNENSPVGTQVLPMLNMTTIRIEAIDADEPNTQNSRVLYSHIGPNSDLFVIDFDTAILTVARGAGLDHESLPVITITIIASDSVPAPNTRSSSVMLRIEVVDENDEAPVFTQAFGYVIPVEEDTPINSNITTEVQANDADTGTGGIVQYFLSTAIPLEATSWFNINRQFGYISLVESLDRESYSIITLMVTAADQGVPSLSSIVSVQISVSDVNDNPPRFTQDIYTTTVPEFLSTGAAAFQVLAQDPDVGSNAAVRYFLPATVEPFSINPNTGVITTTSTLDHETQDQHILLVQACDSGVGPLCDTATVVINVGDFNDEVPQFDIATYNVDVCHTAERDDPIVQPIATDRDSGINSDLIYSLEGETSGLFSIDGATGLIFLTRDVDMDIGTYQLNVVATDSGSTPLSSTAQVIVGVINCTLEDFVFDSPRYYFEIDEGTALSESLSLTAQVSFDSQFFPEPVLNPMSILSGDVLTLKTANELNALGVGQGLGLDREVRGLYTVIVRAEERVTLPATRVSRVAFTSVTLRVRDLNDNRPVFLSELYVFSVFENTTNPLVGNVEAVDEDIGVNAVLSYRISSVSPSPDPPFLINSTTGVITTSRELDRESVQQYEIIVQATDDGGAAMNSTRVLVNVQDINDCTPTFATPVYDVSILENLQPGASVAMVMATDCDIGNNGEVQYRVVGGDTGVFQLDLISGEINALMSLDFELQNTYSLRVLAIDMGVPALSSEQIVNIFVEDFNDCPPEFIAPPTSMTLLENTTLGSVVVDLSVEDCDSGDNGVNGTVFSIIAGNEDGVFIINSATGVLFTVATLDREIVESYSLSIQARDSAGVNSLSSVIQLSVLVGDVNDNEPVFDETLILITINEREQLNQVLIDVSASDLDQGNNGLILYSLLGGQGVFGVDENTGSLSLVTSLDREMVDNYQLTVIARDRGVEPRSSNASILVTVQDNNDNNPLILNIISGITVVQVLESTDTGTPIFMVNATDEDEGSNAQISFFLTDLGLPFHISRTGGTITVNGDLDYETQNEYTLVLMAVDGGSPQQLSTVASLRVRIIDRNDNPPVFTSMMYSGSQDEGMSIGTSILSVLAEDRDQTGSVNAQVEYSLFGGDIEYFIIDPTTGVIANGVILDRETQSNFTLIVLANNSLSDIPMIGTTTVRITVQDVNDEYPVFNQTLYTASLSELSELGTYVLTVSAVDEDQPNNPNSDLVYTLTTMVNNPFDIDPNTGVLTASNPLNYETATSYELEVVATDKGSMPLRNTSIIRISVQDENDEAPSFNSVSYSANVIEDVSTFPVLLANVSYSDADTLPAHRISTISIVSVTMNNGGSANPNMFQVVTNPTTFTGQVYLIESVDFEIATRFIVAITVVNNNTGQGEPCGISDLCQLSGQSVLEVSVVDANDNSPVFSSQLYIGEVSVSAPPGTSLLTVSASDADSTPQFAEVSYEVSTSADGTIRIDPDTGTLFTRGSFENKDGEILTLTVTAVDNMGNSPSNTATSTVEIVVLNDFQRVAINFACGIDVVQRQESFITDTLVNFTTFGIVVEDYSDYSSNTQTTFIFHAIDTTNMIVDFDRFSATIQNRELQLFSLLNSTVCNVTDITSFADLEGYTYPPLLDTETIVILVLCLLLIIGSLFLLIMALRQRVLGLSESRHRKLGEVFFATPGSTSFINEQHGQYREEVEMKGNFQTSPNPMYLEPFETWAGMETSGGESIGESSLQRDNPLYESQEIRMEMFADDSEEEGDADDAELLAAALEDDLDDEDNSITAI